MIETRRPKADLAKLMKDPNATIYRNPKTGQIEVYLPLRRAINLDEANNSPYDGGYNGSSFNLGTAQGATSRASLGGNKSDENSL